MAKLTFRHTEIARTNTNRGGGNWSKTGRRKWREGETAETIPKGRGNKEIKATHQGPSADNAEAGIGAGKS